MFFGQMALIDLNSFISFMPFQASGRISNHFDKKVFV
jgi:hypothetical protein